jgi:hypothetical protein
MEFELTLKIALCRLLVTGERGLRFLVLELVENLPVCDVAHLKVLLDQLAVLVAHTTLSVWDHSIAGVVRLADVAVDA